VCVRHLVEMSAPWKKNRTSLRRQLVMPSLRLWIQLGRRMVEGQKDEKEEEVGHVDASQMRKGGRGS
jgi:hypothetical protein